MDTVRAEETRCCEDMQRLQNEEKIVCLYAHTEKSEISECLETLALTGKFEGTFVQQTNIWALSLLLLWELILRIVHELREGQTVHYNSKAGLGAIPTEGCTLLCDNLLSHGNHF